MTLRHLVSLLAGAFLASTLQLAPASEDETPADVKQLQQSGEIMSQEDLLKRVHSQFRGKVVDIRLERKGRRSIYDVNLIADNGIKQELQFDARTGELLDTAEGEQENGDRK
jgi:uncharacterized membrane protein YkoI